MNEMKCILLVLVVSLVGLIIPSAFAESVPDWVKNTAGWWATDAISETEFVNAIEFLIKEDIIQVNVPQTSGTSQGVPDWVKNTAGWWATDAISETEFVNAIAYLIKVGIITVEEKLIQTDADFRVAFIGDQGYNQQSIAVLNLIKDEGAQMVLHQGDFDYKNNPDAWDKMISDVLGDDFPYFASMGQHDQKQWSDYQQKLNDRLKKNPDVECVGDLGVKSSCIYKGLFFILIGPGNHDTALSGSGHSSFIEDQLNKSDNVWRICSWSKTMHYMQLGTKPDKVEWEIYENCKNGGAIIATAHEHSYHRTKTLIDIENQIVDPRWHEPDELRVKEGSTFVFVSGLGGHSIRDQDRCLPVSYPYGCNDEWAKIYTSDQNADFGALFCTFNIDKQPSKADCYFKNIQREVIDEFSVTNFVGIDDADSNLPKIDLSNKDVAGMILVGADLTDVDFTGTNLKGANLSLVNLAGVDLSNKDLTGTILRAANLNSATLDGTMLIGTNLSNSVLTNVDLSGKYLADTILKGADLSNSNLADTDLSGKDLTKIILKGADLSNSNLTNANLIDADLSDIDLTGVKLRGADLTNANLIDADLSDIDLTGVKLTGADMSNSNLTGVNLSGMNLTGVKFRNMDLTDHDLTGTILIGADLTNAVLPSDYLSENDFTDAVFDGVNLSGKKISNSDFSFVSFKNTNMEDMVLENLKFLGVDFTKIKNKSLTETNGFRVSFAYANLSDVNLDNSELNSVNFQNADLTDQDFTNNITIIGGDFLSAELSKANFDGSDFGLWTTSRTFENQGYVIKDILDSPGELRTAIENELFHLTPGTKNIMLLMEVHLVGDDVVVEYGKLNNFSKANLENASFKNANLRYAAFQNANLEGADLTGANLEGADLTGANLEGANLNCLNHSICLNQ